MPFLLFLLQIDVNEKIKNAPNNNYQIGVWIGSILPFAVLVGLAYLVYFINKKRKDNDY